MPDHRHKHWHGLVLDTHMWVWAVAGDERARALSEFPGPMIIPAISIWEVAMLALKGRLELSPSPEDWVEKNMSAPFQLEPLHPEISLESCRLEDFHGDPSDRIIVATAMQLGLPLVTADSKIQHWNRSFHKINCLDPSLSPILP